MFMRTLVQEDQHSEILHMTVSDDAPKILTVVSGYLVMLAENLENTAQDGLQNVYSEIGCHLSKPEAKNHISKGWVHKR